MSFESAVSSHNHSLETLNELHEYDDFMLSLNNVADMGCGKGLDLEWWADLHTREDIPKPLKISCTGFDVLPKLSVAHTYSNIIYQKQNIEDKIQTGKKTFDVVWCHDTFQYMTNPMQTLSNWNQAMSENGMLVLILPSTINLRGKHLDISHLNTTYYHYSLLNLMYMLAMNGFDCADGFMKHDFYNNWLYAAVYKSEHKPVAPALATWHDMAEKNLIPQTAIDSINKYNCVRQEDLVLKWVDSSLTWYGNQ